MRIELRGLAPDGEHDFLGQLFGCSIICGQALQVTLNAGSIMLKESAKTVAVCSGATLHPCVQLFARWRAFAVLPCLVQAIPLMLQSA